MNLRPGRPTTVARALWCAAIVVVLAGCGYHFAGDKLGLPADVHSLRIGTIRNRSREQGLEKTLAFALEQEIALHRQFRMVEGPSGADAVLSGTIRAVRLRPVAFDSNDLAVQYEINILLDMSLRRESDGHVLWYANGMRDLDEYSANSQVVVTSSSQFQRQTLDAGNLPCQTPTSGSGSRPCNPQFSNIQMAETFRQDAVMRLLHQAARNVYNQMVEGF